ncbi:hypothetical protein RUND412_009822 [Rhizina undulata]
MAPRRVPRVGKWLPEEHALLQNWVTQLIERVTIKCPTPQTLHPVIEEFKNLIETDPIIYMLFNQMFQQIPNKPPYNNDPTGKPQVRDYHLMLKCFNEIMTTAPQYQKDVGLVGFPINAILDWPMGTPSGFAAFLNDKVNAQVGKMLNEWARFLGSPASTYVLSKDAETGWFSEKAMAEEQMKNFNTTFKCEPTAEHHGFKSWDNFFTREFQDGVRPVMLPDDDRFIANACESAPYNIQLQVKERDRFWIKTQSYSVSHMLAGDDYTPQFVGGTVYQAFLSALSYHRWHSPVTGTIVKTYVVPGTYYSEARMAMFDNSAPNESQAYITEVATRALIFIEADNPDIGLMCFMAVGMAEVSTCDIRVEVGQRVRKGEQLGMFHFGGSTHCLLFRKGVKVVFTLSEKPGLDAKPVPVNSVIAFVPSSSSETQDPLDLKFISGDRERDCEEEESWVMVEGR